MAFTCPCCKRTSEHPEDERHGFCGACHWWTGDPGLAAPHLAKDCPAREEPAVQPVTVSAVPGGFRAGNGGIYDLPPFPRRAPALLRMTAPRWLARILWAAGARRP